MVAKTIQAAPALPHKRQIFFLDLGSFDHHSQLLDTKASPLCQLDDNLSVFNTAMDDAELGDQVTTFIASEFSRTIRSNRRGSDHAWSAARYGLRSKGI